MNKSHLRIEQSAPVIYNSYRNNYEYTKHSVACKTTLVSITYLQHDKNKEMPNCGTIQG